MTTVELFRKWYDSLPYGEPSYQETFDAGYQAGIDSVKYEGELPELPKPCPFVSYFGQKVFTRDTMQDYARQAIAGALAKVGPSEPVKRLKDIADGVRLYGAPDKDLLAQRLDAIAEVISIQQPATKKVDQSEIVAYMIYSNGSRKHSTLTFDTAIVPEIYIGGEVVPLYATPQPAPAIDLSRLDPFVHGLGKAILADLKVDQQAQPAQPLELSDVADIATLAMNKASGNGT